MKNRLFCVVSLLLGLSVMSFAKPPKVDKGQIAKVKIDKEKITKEVPHIVAPTAEKEEAEPVLTEECVVNLSLFNEYAKNKQYADAWEPWLQVYENCPNANKAIYTKGADILDWKIANASSAEEKAKYVGILMQMYDKRIRYFGDDAKYPKAYILGQKGIDYCTYFESDSLKLPAYEWLKESVNGMGENSQIKVLTKLMEVSNGLYKADATKYGEQYIADYSLITTLLQRMNDNPACKYASAAGQNKEYVDNLFASSGAANCEKLDELYAPLIATNSQYMEDMLKLVRLYKKVGCTNSEVYFAASQAVHKMQPTEESAAGCARMCVKKDEFEQAIDYYKEAIALIDDEDDDSKADYQYQIALIYMNELKRYSDARSYARLSLETKADQGRCYILIGCCYAASRPYSTSEYPEAKARILNKTVFWAAVDKFIQAKQDPSCKADADKLIATYSQYFPTKEDIFDLPNELGGPSFLVGGWIGERTVCRPLK